MKLVATSTIRAGDRDAQPGGLYLVDLDDRSVATRSAGKAELRGIAFDGEVIYVAGNQQLLAYSPEFRLLESFSNPYLRDCREMAVYERTLYVVAAACDAILGFDLDARRFHWAMHVATNEHRFAGRRFDPHGKDGPLPVNKLDLDSIHCSSHGMYIGGSRSDGLLHFNGKTIRMAAQLPAGSRNARPFRDGVLFNDTAAGALRYTGRGEGCEDRAMRVPPGEAGDSTGPGLARGLCVMSDTVVAGGSSPATVTLYDLAANRQLLSVRVAQSSAEAIHTIAVWPYDQDLAR